MAKLILNDMVVKSRKLLNKLSSNSSDVIYTKEDYFMFCVSKFIALKEILIQKDSRTNTLYFNYKKFKNIYPRIKFMIDSIIETNPEIKMFINNQEINMCEEKVFGSNNEIVLPLKQKIIIENFKGSLEEKNEMIRVLWIFSKIRDAFAHGTDIEFDMSKSKINLRNQIEDKELGGFKIKLSIAPELLNFISFDNANNYFPLHRYADEKEIERLYNAYYKYLSNHNNYKLIKDSPRKMDIYKNNYTEHLNLTNNTTNNDTSDKEPIRNIYLNEVDYYKPLKMIDYSLYKLIDYNDNLLRRRNYQRETKVSIEDVKYISDADVLKSLRSLVIKYSKVKKSLSPSKRKYIENIIRGYIYSFSKEGKTNDKKAHQMLDDLNKIFGINNDNYFSVLYSHMILLFSSNIYKMFDLRYIKSANIKFDDTEYRVAIKKIIDRTAKQIKKMFDYKYSDDLYKKSITTILGSINDVENILADRNKYLLNNIRNGVMHKSCKLTSDGRINITNCPNTKDKSVTKFSTSCNCKDMALFLESIENPSIDCYSFSNLFDELRGIIGQSDNLEKYINFINTIYSYTQNKKENLNEEEESLN